MHSDGACAIRAWLGEVWFAEEYVTVTGFDSEDGSRGQSHGAQAVDSATLKSGVLDFINQMGARNVPISGLWSAAARCDFHDDRAFVNALGVQRRWLAADSLAEYWRPGVHMEYWRPPGGPMMVKFANPTIVLRDRYADAARDGTLLNAQGVTSEGETVLNELFHSLVHQHDLEFQVHSGDEHGQPATPPGDEGLPDAVDEEEYWSDTVQLLVVESVKAATKLLLPNPTHQDLHRLRMILMQIRSWMRHLKARNPALFARIMHWLGFDDANDGGGGSNGDGTNNIPDFLDNLLIQRGLNFDTLPVNLLPPEAGCNDGFFIDPPDFFDKGEPQDGQYAFVVGCNDVYLLYRNTSGNLVLEPAPEP